MRKNIVIFVTSLKGGSGKSTIAWNLAVMYAQQGVNVAVLDMDKNHMCFTAYTARHYKQRNSRRGLQSIKVYELIPDTLQESILSLRKNFEVLIIDSACFSDELTQSLHLADFVLLSTLPHRPDIDLLINSWSKVFKVIQSKGQSIPVGIVINGVPEMRTKEPLFIHQLSGLFGTFVFKKVLHRRAAYEHCLTEGLSINELQNSYKDEKAQGELKRLFDEIKQNV